MKIRKDKFPQMSLIIPKGKSSEFSIEKKRITKDDAKRCWKEVKTREFDRE